MKLTGSFLETLLPRHNPTTFGKVISVSRSFWCKAITSHSSFPAAASNGETHKSLSDTFSNYHDYTASNGSIRNIFCVNSLYIFFGNVDWLAVRCFDFLDWWKSSAYCKEVWYDWLSDWYCRLSCYSFSHPTFVSALRWSLSKISSFFDILGYGLLASMVLHPAPLIGLEVWLTGMIPIIKLLVCWLFYLFAWTIIIWRQGHFYAVVKSVSVKCTNGQKPNTNTTSYVYTNSSDHSSPQISLSNRSTLLSAAPLVGVSGMHGTIVALITLFLIFVHLFWLTLLHVCV